MTDKCDSINIIYFLQLKVLFISIIQEITRCNALCLPWIRTKSKMRFNFISFIPVTNEKVLIMIYNGIKRIIRRVGSRLILLTLKRKKKWCDRISNSRITITQVLYEGSINESKNKMFYSYSEFRKSVPFYGSSWVVDQSQLTNSYEKVMFRQCYLKSSWASHESKTR